MDVLSIIFMLNAIDVAQPIRLGIQYACWGVLHLTSHNLRQLRLHKMLIDLHDLSWFRGLVLAIYMVFFMVRLYCRNPIRPVEDYFFYPTGNVCKIWYVFGLSLNSNEYPFERVNTIVDK